MAVTQNNGACPALLVGLNEIIGTNGPQNLIEPVGLMQALRDPSNPVPKEIREVGAENGHTKQVRISYRNRALPAAVTSTKTCGTGTEKTTLEDLFAVGQYRQIIVRKSEASVRALCDAYSQMVALDVSQRTGIPQVMVMRDFANDIMQDLPVLRYQINDALNDLYATKVGAWQGGATSKTFTVRQALVNGSDGAPVLDGFAKMKQEINRIGLGLQPILFGEGIFDLANDALNYGCCNAGGTDFGQMAKATGYKFYRDFVTSTAGGLGLNAVGAFLPGYVQLATFNEYVGSFAGPFANDVRGTMPDPVIPGLRYDVRIRPTTDCTDLYDIIIGLHFDLWVAPDDTFATGDRLAGVNGALKLVAAEMV